MTNKFQKIGIIISLLFLIIAALFGFNLGRALLIGSILFLIVLVLYFGLWLVAKLFQKREEE